MQVIKPPSNKISQKVVWYTVSKSPTIRTKGSKFQNEKHKIKRYQLFFLFPWSLILRSCMCWRTSR